ncbi:hypothetical protein WMF27_05250 [Sorangium sp. So ce281]|uniref:hypothetical protein n=1 Tax=unclassified Sorangium TaxID=2621164 RepID=UPI003F5E1ECC
MIRFAPYARCVLVPAVLVLVVACSGSPPGADGSGGADTDGDQTTGGTGTGGENGSGGAQQGSGGTSHGAGGRGDLMAGQCDDAYPCGAGATCYAPGERPPAICGAPDWCGTCECPAMLPIPEGNGASCNESNPCPTTSATVPRAASLCDPATNLCTECVIAEDCSEALPHCGTDSSTGIRMCFECAEDADCGGDAPHCFKLTTPIANELGACRQCKTTADCDTGVCDINGMCTPGCQNDAQCGPNRVCGAEKRCVPQSCQDDAACSPQSACSDQTCRAIPCSTDASCPDGHCVKGSCYEIPGFCEYDTAG